MDFMDGEVVNITIKTRTAYIENGRYTTSAEATEKQIKAIIVSGFGLSSDKTFVEYVPMFSGHVPPEKRNATLIQLEESAFSDGLTVECGLIATISKDSVTRLGKTLADENLQKIRTSIKDYLNG